MAEDNEIKDVAEEEIVSLAPYVNEALKYWLLAGVAILCIIAALAVVFSPEAEKNREKKAEQTNTAVVTEVL